MNVAFVLRRFTTDGGTERYAVGLAQLLVARGHEVSVYCAYARDDVAALPGVRVVRVAPAHPGGAVGEALFLAGSARVVLGGHDVVQGFGRTLVHDVYRAGGGVHRAWLRARYPGLTGRLRVAASPSARVATWLDQQAQVRARVVVCNSEMSARQVSAFHRIPPNRIRVVRNGVDGDRFRPDPERRATARREWGVPDGGRVCLFLGNGFRRKGLLVAVRAFTQVAGPDDRFVVAGSDAHAERFLRVARSALGPRLVEAGALRAPEAWLPGADVTVLPTLYDSAANTVLESMACGVPAVTTSMDGNAELVPDAAWVARDPRDVGLVARAVHAAWSDRGAAARCRAVAVAWPSSRNGEAMLQLYREIADE